MKRIVYIAFVAVGLLAVSCSKENIRPNRESSSELPVWRSTTGGSIDGDVITDDGTITDPNNDRDENSRRRNN